MVRSRGPHRLAVNGRNHQPQWPVEFSADVVFANLPHSCRCQPSPFQRQEYSTNVAGGDGLWHGRRLEPYAFPFLRGMLKPVFGLAADANVAKHRGGLFYVVADDVDAGGEAPPSSCSPTHTPCPHTCTMS